MLLCKSQELNLNSLCISFEVISMDLTKVQAIILWPSPNSFKEGSQLPWPNILIAATHIGGFSTIVAPISKCLKGETY